MTDYHRALLDHRRDSAMVVLILLAGAILAGGLALWGYGSTRTRREETGEEEKGRNNGCEKQCPPPFKENGGPLSDIPHSMRRCQRENRVRVNTELMLHRVETPRYKERPLLIFEHFQSPLQTQ
ncbi:hypothetical protein KM043_008272 [Ampulex compressa]|nr:hypothetical protein KM043_008272 [Ampulex compressa]